MSEEEKRLKLEEEINSVREDIDGLVLFKKYIPFEFLKDIFRTVDLQTLLSCQLVCKHWRYVIHNFIWREKAEKISGRKLPMNESASWLEYYFMCSKQPFNNNLIKNHSGIDKFEHWTIDDYTLRSRFDKWSIECPPVGAPALPEDPVFDNKQHCFATRSTQTYAKSQTIDLIEAGFTETVLDKMQPTVKISEYFSNTCGRPSLYSMKVLLIGKNDLIMYQYELTKMINRQDCLWCRYSKEFKNYGQGLRKIKFIHKGQEVITNEMIANSFNGAKMAGACVKLAIPKLKNDDKNRLSTENCLDSPSKSILRLLRI